MALYTATYTEANTITFDVEVPDGMPVDEAYEWLMDHWDETVVPHLDTREMTLVENGLDAVQPATTSVRNAAGNQASYPPASTASNTRCSAPTTGAATSSAPNAPNSSVRKSVGEYRENERQTPQDNGRTTTRWTCLAIVFSGSRMATLRNQYGYTPWNDQTSCSRRPSGRSAMTCNVPPMPSR